MQQFLGYLCFFCMLLMYLCLTPSLYCMHKRPLDNTDYDKQNIEYKQHKVEKKLTVEEIIQSGIDINQATFNGWPLLHWTILENDMQVLAWLLKQTGIDVHKIYHSLPYPAFFALIQKNHAALSMLLQTQKINILQKNANNKTLLDIAIAHLDKESIALLLHHGAAVLPHYLENHAIPAELKPLLHNFYEQQFEQLPKEQKKSFSRR